MSMRGIAVLGIMTLAVAAAAQENTVLPGPKEKLSYALGMNLGNQLKSQGLEIDMDTFIEGIKAVLAGGKPLMSEAEAQAALIELANQLKQKQEETNKALAERNKSEGEAFLAANRSKEGVITLPSGLQYKILKAGGGAKPGAGDTVECNYRGTFLDGTEFDSSYKHNQTATFPVNGVIKGWTEALQLMQVGSKWQLFVPSSLAYGENGRQGIPPNATLIFEVELISIKNQ
jgi:FKBP-type peptidyl-prolyl cis-trans isomerase